MILLGEESWERRESMSGLWGRGVRFREKKGSQISGAFGYLFYITIINCNHKTSLRLIYRNRLYIIFFNFPSGGQPISCLYSSEFWKGHDQLKTDILGCMYVLSFNLHKLLLCPFSVALHHIICQLFVEFTRLVVDFTRIELNWTNLINWSMLDAHEGFVFEFL